jgi:hypothetical protein
MFHTPTTKGIWSIALVLWALLWGASGFIGADALASLGISLNAHGHSHLHVHGHPFADARSWWGIPNTVDVLSNLPMSAVGLWGCWRVAHLLPRHSLCKMPALLAFAGLVLSGVGSWIYHWHPVPETLVLDRMGMAVTFAGVLGWVVAERLQAVWSYRFALCVMVLGWVSAAWPVWQGKLMPWVVLQFGGLLLIAGHAALSAGPSQQALRFKTAWWGVVAWYVLAKLFELFDAQVWVWTHELVAGHALKHLVAACALWPLLVACSDCGKMPGQQAFVRNAV